MATREALVNELKNLPDDVKARLANATSDQKKIFIDGLSKRISTNDLPADVKINDVRTNPVQKAIQSSRSGSIPMTPLGAIPMNAREAMDLPRVALSQFQSGVNSLPIKLGANMADPMSGYRNRLNQEAYEKMITPETDYGRTMNTQATVAQFASPALDGVNAMAKFVSGGGVNKLVNKIPAVKNYKATAERLAQNAKLTRDVENSLTKLDEDLVKIQDSSKMLKENLRSNSRALGYEASKSAKDATDLAFESAKTNYGNVVMNLKGEKVPLSDATRILNDIIVDGGLRNKTILDDAESALFDLQKRFDGKLVESGKMRMPDGTEMFTEVSVTNPGLDASELKTFKNVVRAAIKNRPDLEAKFYKNYGEVLEANGMGDLASANEKYSKAYDLYENLKQAKRNNFSNIASGRIGRNTQEFKDILNAEKSYGSNYAEKAADMYDEFVAKQKDLLGKKITLEDEKNINAKFLKYLKSQAKNHSGKLKFYESLKRTAIKSGIASAVTTGVAGSGLLAYELFKKQQ